MIPKLPTREAAAYLTKNGFPCRPGSLEVWRALGRGPAYIKAARRVLYDAVDLDAFIGLKTQRVQTIDSRVASSGGHHA